MGINALLEKTDQKICDFTLECRVSCKNCSAVDNSKHITVRYLHSNLYTEFTEGWVDRSMEHQIYKSKCCRLLTNSVVSKIQKYPKMLFVVHSSENDDDDEQILSETNVQSTIKFFNKIYKLNACIYLSSDHYTCLVYSQHFNDILFNDPTLNNAIFVKTHTDQFPSENIKLAIYVDKHHLKSNNYENQTFVPVSTIASNGDSISRNINFSDFFDYNHASIPISQFDGLSPNVTPCSLSDSNIAGMDIFDANICVIETNK